MKTPDQSGREKQIFERALDLTRPGERLAYLQQACGGDDALLDRVQTLLRAEGAPGAFLPDRPADASAATVMGAEVEEQPGSNIGHYKLLQKIGEGGCGVVYMAEQEEPVRRRVALKIIKLGMDTKLVVARFEAERQALAMMDHPNIAKVFDAGSTASGRPYFVMELVRGIPITKYCDESNLPMAQRLELFSLVCHAIQHAHQKGIIHRDIKPSNILVTLHDGEPVPKVIDFGIAKATQGRLTDQTLFTAFEQFIGTPAYMSPEQAEMSGLDIDTRSDIYSLGVLLYELLTGQPPFDPKSLVQAGLDEIRRQIREVEPPKPSSRLATLTIDNRTTVARLRGAVPAQLSSQLSGDLDWIVMKALEKNRTRRYETASALAADLQRHINNEPVIARPPSTIYLLEKLVRRHRVACTAGAVIFVSLIAGLGVSVWAYFNEKAARQFAVETMMSLRKASDFNREIMIRAADNKRRAEASDQRAAIDAAQAAYAMAAMRALTTRAEQTPSSGADPAALADALAPVADRLLRDAAIPPEAKWELSEHFGDVFFELGSLARAETLFAEAVKLRRTAQGEGNPDLLPVTRKLIETLRRQGKDREADATQLQGERAHSAYLRGGQWIKRLRAEARELQSRGQYAAAEAKLQEATAVARDNPPDRYRAIDDVGPLTWLRFDAGDLTGARQLALHWLAAEKSDRRWNMAGPFGFLTRGLDSLIPPYDAHTVLGLIALREGNALAARAHLLKSANGITRWTELDWRKLQLATMLAAAGDTDTASQFLDRIRAVYVDSYLARSPENTLFSSENSTFHNAAIGQQHAQQLASWQLDLSAGRVPADWMAMRTTQPPPAAVHGPSLPPVASLSLPAAKTTAALFRPLSPFAFLLLGWCTSAAVSHFRAGLNLPRAAGWWLLAFCVLRTVDCALFTGMLIGDGLVIHMFVPPFISFFSWLLLWHFIRALLPGEVSRWEARLMYALTGFGLLALAALSLVGYMSNPVVLAIVCVACMLLLVLFTFALAFSVCYVAGRRLWRWQQSAALNPPQRLCLKLAAPLLLLHGWISLFAGGMHEALGPFAEAIFWASALLPWLLAAGFFPFENDVIASDVLAKRG